MDDDLCDSNGRVLVIDLSSVVVVPFLVFHGILGCFCFVMTLGDDDGALLQRLAMVS